jgi:Alcohol dehydrogenase, class IV
MMPDSRVFRVPSTTHVGAGAAAHTGPEAARLGSKRALLITDAFLFSSGTLQPVLDSISKAGLEYFVFDKVNSEPTTAHVEDGLAMFKESGCDIIVAAGGGSPIDVAKGVSALVANPGHIQDYMGYDKVAKQGPPIIAVPTTAGTGSEATMVTIITDTVKDVKMLITSPWLLAKVAIVDPLLTLGMPKGITAATGLDALTHAIEAYVSRKAQPMTDILALSAVRLIYRNLPIAWAEPKNAEARANTLLGALQAGIAFSNASVALVHGMSRPVGALFHVPHGVSNACLLGVVTDFSLEGAYERYADVARAMGVKEEGDAKEIAQEGAKKIRQIIKDLEVPTLAQLGVTREKLEPVVGKMADDAIASGSPGNNPRLASKEEIIKLYFEAL